MRSRKEYCTVLGVDEIASDFGIKKAFRKKLLEFHPDKCSGDDTQAKLIIEAYTALILKPNQDVSTTSSEESKPNDIVGFISYQGRKSKRNRNEPVDPSFNYEEFRSVLLVMVACHDEESIEILLSFVEENINNLQAVIKSGEKVKDIFDWFQDEAAYELITQFDVQWLKNFEYFSRPSRLAQFLDAIPVQYWKMTLDHLGFAWLKNQLNPSIVIEMTRVFSSYDKKQFKDKGEELLVTKYQTLFEYLGQEWLANPIQLGKFLNFANNPLFRKTLLSFLKDEIAKKVRDGYKLGRILEDIAEQSAVSAMTSTQSDFFITAWTDFLECLAPSWQRAIANDFTQLNSILNQLDFIASAPKKIPYFLNTYVDKKIFSHFHDLIAVLKKNDEEKCSAPLDHRRSIDFIQSFSDKEIHDCWLRRKKFDEVFRNISLHERQPFYKALLYALTIAYRYERQSTQKASTSTREFIWSYTPLCHDLLQKIDAANSLAAAIADDKPVASAWVINGVEELRQINHQYTKIRNPNARLQDVPAITYEEETVPALQFKETEGQDDFVNVTKSGRQLR